MSKGLNNCIFVGRLGADPELRFLQSGQAKLSMRLAVDETYKDREGNEKGSTTWVSLTMWGKGAESLSKFLKKGQQLTVVSRFHSYSYDDRDGNKKYATEFIVDNLIFGAAPKGSVQGEDAPADHDGGGHGGGGGYRRGGGQGNQSSGGGGDSPPRDGGGQRQQRQADPPPVQEEPVGDFDDQDIPF